MELWARNCPVILPKFRLPLKFKDLLHAAKSTTWDRRLYFPSEGRRAEDFFRPKNLNIFHVYFYFCDISKYIGNFSRYFQNFYLFIPRFLAVFLGSASPVEKQRFSVVLTTEKCCFTMRGISHDNFFGNRKAVITPAIVTGV